MSKRNANLSIAVRDIAFFTAPTRIPGTKFWKIGTTKPNPPVLLQDVAGHCSILYVRAGTAIFVRRKDIRTAFGGNPTVKEAVATINAEPPKKGDKQIFLRVTLEKSLPELFRRHRGTA